MLTAKCDDDVCDFCSADCASDKLREWGDWLICPTCHAAEWAAEEREQERGEAMAVWEAEAWK